MRKFRDPLIFYNWVAEIQFFNFSSQEFWELMNSAECAAVLLLKTSVSVLQLDDVPIRLDWQGFPSHVHSPFSLRLM